MATPTPVVTFDQQVFLARYSEFAALTLPMLQAYFAEAGDYFENAARNPTSSDPAHMLRLMNMVTAHIAWMNAPRDATGNPATTGQPASPIVGRINSASEGSVSVGAEYNTSGSPSEAWFLQTKYGAAFWQATAQYRTALYSARPTMVPGGGLPQYVYGRRYPYC